MSKNIVIGIDPGTRITGYGVLTEEKGKPVLVDYGTIRPSPSLPLHDRYWILYGSLLQLIERFSPQAMAIETQFVQKNAQSALKLGMARGALIIAAKQKGIDIIEYTPSRAKKAVTGRGNATKQQVGEMVAALLQLPAPPKPEDAADALALAYCLFHQTKRETCTPT